MRSPAGVNPDGSATKPVSGAIREISCLTSAKPQSSEPVAGQHLLRLRLPIVRAGAACLAAGRLGEDAASGAGPLWHGWPGVDRCHVGHRLDPLRRTDTGRGKAILGGLLDVVAVLVPTGTDHIVEGLILSAMPERLFDLTTAR